MAAGRLAALTWGDSRLWPQFVSLLADDPAAAALIDCDEREWSRADLAKLADDAFTRISEFAQAGDRIMVRGDKCAAFVAIALAVSRLEAVLCPYSPKLSPAEIEVLEQRLGHVVRIDPASDGTFELTRRERSGPADARDGRTALIGFTSGTTGVPKGVMHGPEALNYATRCCAAIADAEAGKPILGIVPLDSAPGFTFTVHFALSLGYPLVLIDQWDPAEAIRRAIRYDCTWAIGVPTHLISMVEAARESTDGARLPLRAMAVGGSAMTADLIREADELLGLKALRMYGMSECMGHCSVHPDHGFATRTSCDGLPFPGTEDRAFDRDDMPLADGERGQAGVRGPSLFLGYANGLGAGQEKLTPDGYFLTGDEIVVDEGGLVRVVGRIKDQIIRGGYNLDPAEIEEAILRHRVVKAAAVVPVPHARLGEQACAIVCLHEPRGLDDLETLCRHLQAVGLNKKKWPEYLLAVDSLPVTANGKIDKKALSQMATQRLAPVPDPGGGSGPAR